MNNCIDSLTCLEDHVRRRHASVDRDSTRADNGIIVPLNRMLPGERRLVPSQHSTKGHIVFVFNTGSDKRGRIIKRRLFFSLNIRTLGMEDRRLGMCAGNSILVPISILEPRR